MCAFMYSVKMINWHFWQTVCKLSSRVLMNLTKTRTLKELTHTHKSIKKYCMLLLDLLHNPSFILNKFSSENRAKSSLYICEKQVQF